VKEKRKKTTSIKSSAQSSLGDHVTISVNIIPN